MRYYSIPIEAVLLFTGLIMAPPSSPFFAASLLIGDEAKIEAKRRDLGDKKSE